MIETAASFLPRYDLIGGGRLSSVTPDAISLLNSSSATPGDHKKPCAKSQPAARSASACAGRSIPSAMT
jgi:hypothetical protein